VLKYHFEMDQLSALDPSASFLKSMQEQGTQMAPIKPNRNRSRFEGQLTLKVLAREDAIATVVYSFENMSATMTRNKNELPGEARQALGKAVSQEVVVRIDNLGRIHGVSTAPNLVPAQANFVRGFVSALRFQLPRKKSSTWGTEERDLLGSFLGRYRLVESKDSEDLGIEKSKDYQSITMTGQTNPQKSGEIEPNYSGGILVQFDIDKGRIQLLEGQEQILMTGEKLPYQIQANLLCRLRLLSSENSPSIVQTPEAIANFLSRWKTSGDFQAESIADDLQAERDASKKAWAEKTSLDALLTGLDKLATDHMTWLRQAGPVIKALSTFFESRPEELRGALIHALDPKAHDSKVRQAILNAMGRAGTPEAQALLTELLGNESAESFYRGSALLALSHLETPTTETVRTVRDLATQKDSLGLRALQTLGILADRLAQSGDPQACQKLVDMLNTRLENSQDEIETRRALLGLGNAGRTESATTVSRYLENDSETIRTSAAQAMARMKTAQATRQMAQMVSEDPSAQVRSQLIKSLEQHGGREAESALSRVVREENETRVRRTALAALLRMDNQGSSTVRQAIQYVATNDRDPKIRERAQAHLDRTKR
jgi:HEAT repeat protein